MMQAIPEPEPQPRRAKWTPQERAQHALDSAERRVVKAMARAAALRMAAEAAEDEYAAQVRARDYLATNPALHAQP
jgi:hypothetical protein